MKFQLQCALELVSLWVTLVTAVPCADAPITSVGVISVGGDPATQTLPTPPTMACACSLNGVPTETTGPVTTPATSTWTVSDGDTGETIASIAGIPFTEVSEANPTVTWTALTIGELLLLPPLPTRMPQVTGIAAVTASYQETGVTAQNVQNRFFSGDGSVANGWPDISQWLPFDAMWANLQPLGQNCLDFVPGNTQNETEYVKAAIAYFADLTDVDPRFILAVVVQESSGCVRAPSTAVAHGNPGLMQSDQGTGTCNANGTLLQPCSCCNVHQMIFDGTAGPNLDSDSINLVNELNEASAMGGDDVAQVYYRAARLYNSGPHSLDNMTDLGGSPGATLCYASDIANRLVGWVNGPSSCTLDNNKAQLQRRRSYW